MQLPFYHCFCQREEISEKKETQTQTSIVIIAQMCNIGLEIIYNFQRINSTAAIFIISKRKEENKTNNFCYPYSILIFFFFFAANIFFFFCFFHNFNCSRSVWFVRSNSHFKKPIIEIDFCVCVIDFAILCVSIVICPPCSSIWFSIAFIVWNQKEKKLQLAQFIVWHFKKKLKVHTHCIGSNDCCALKMKSCKYKNWVIVIRSFACQIRCPCQKGFSRLDQVMHQFNMSKSNVMAFIDALTMYYMQHTHLASQQMWTNNDFERRWQGKRSENKSEREK